ncbi:MAG: phenylalanine--tRNA ligase subunit beta [Dethiobacteria bacterium]|jgi:phenylalanyl-tRNA synthetase beta chain|nr:phenylalanine--tRNA ligase subunit beta [Bacillota bacterium]NMD32882.1 phenylalanine--tRNA ligase subunit beta [Bacillota bacterium]HOB28926.1 phenylalanine--tRNA ligase subunit beta [Bacillota bacterium]HPZ41490.1 phenylalanine--tRNA ligase subunit beta [Bacillota bacterium]HQD52442.1 phenylalanine--tRNA ligase subunit beta [Bacillota bacterium]
MRIAYSWLKEYIDLELSPEELAEKLTLAGVEVEAVEQFAEISDRVVVGEIITLKPHPHNSRLLVAGVDPGDGSPLQIVCGAPNIAAGQKVPLALPGAVLPGRGCLEALEIERVFSEGMLCSGKELGLELGSPDGVLILDPPAKTGSPLSEALELNDHILILDLTPNRADCLGLLGIAYEVAALTGAAVKHPPAEPPEAPECTAALLRVDVQEPLLCPRYTARVIEDLTVGSSPLWLQLRLLKSGLRPINNVVDITNYVMWEYGQPLHAFDFNLTRGGEIIVRRGRSDETLVTLDGDERVLDEEVLVIADAAGPVALGGVMGGESTEINPSTRSVLLEAALFNPVSVRRTARRYHIPSEASQRFERGVNPAWVAEASGRAALMISELAGGRVLRGLIDSYPAPVQPRRVMVRPYRINEILGLKIPSAEVSDILSRLGFTIKPEGRRLEVTVPLRRNDIFLEEDIVEEVARLYGYDKIPATLPRGELLESREELPERLQGLVRETLTACGFNEIITYSFINPTSLRSLGLPEGDPRLEAIPLRNPLSEEQSIMRTTLLPGLLKTLQDNFYHREMNQLLFEVGAAYLPRQLPLEELPDEKLRLSLGATGELPVANWYTASRPAGFFVVKGAIEALLKRFGINRVEYLPAELPFNHPTRSAVIRIAGEEAGFLGELRPQVAEKWDYPQPVTVAELDLEMLIARANLVPRVTPLPKYPAGLRDIAVVVPRALSAGELKRLIYEAGGGLVEQVTLFDLYEGAQIPPGMRSLAFTITYRHPDRTLTEAEINAAQARIEAALSKLGAALRR